MKWLKKNIILVIIIILAAGLASSVWWLPGAVGVVLFFLSRFSWGEETTKHLKTGALMFILATVLWFSIRLANLYSAEESVTAATERNALKIIAEMSENTAEAYRLKMSACAKLQEYYLAKDYLDSAALCSDMIIKISKRAIVAQLPLGEPLRERNGDTPQIQLVSEKKPEFELEVGEEKAIWLEKGTPFDARILMKPGQRFQLFDNSLVVVYNRMELTNQVQKTIYNPNGDKPVVWQTKGQDYLIVEGTSENAHFGKVKRLEDK